MTDAQPNAARRAGSCPSTDVLEQLLADELAESEAVVVQEHLDHCPHCLAELERLSGHAEVQRLAAEVGAIPSGDLKTSGLAYLIRKLRETPSEASLSSTPPPAGRAVSSPPGYEIEGVLGQGGMGIVYRARQIGLKRPVALKMILAGEYADEEGRTRFRHEAEAVARLSHSNIVQIHDIGEHEGRPFFSLEFCEAGSLKDRLKDSPLQPHEAARLVQTLAAAMAHAHHQGIIHRDLKPGNVLLASDPSEPPNGKETGKDSPVPLADCTPKVSDFGLAKRLEDASVQTRPGAILGTPSYMAPEQAAGNVKEVGPATDVYALGTILYECLTGRPPFKGATALDTVDQVRSQEPVPPRQLQPKVARDLETICLKCLQKEAVKRYASAKELADDLGRWLNGEPIRARRAGTLYHLGKFARRNRALVGGLAAVFLALIVGILGTSYGLIQAQQESQRALNAELGIKSLLAASRADAGRLALQQGQWGEALRQIDLALQEGHEDPISLRLDRIRALRALVRAQEALTEINDLEQLPLSGGQKGLVLLRKAELLLGHKDEDAIQLFHRALNEELPEVEREFVQGVLAADTPTAVRHFENVLNKDPLHRGSHGFLAMLLVMLGRAEDADRRLDVATTLFPEDYQLILRQTFVSVLRKNDDRARQLGARLRAMHGEAAGGIVNFIIEAAGLLRDYNEHLESGSPAPVMKQLTSLLMKYPGVISRAREVPSLSSWSFFHLPPVIASRLSPMADVKTWLAVSLGSEEAIKELTQVVQTNPDGYFHFLRGITYLGKRRYPEAEADLQKASTLPAFLPVRRPALFQLAVVRTRLMMEQKRSAADLKLRELCAQALRQFVTLGDPRPGTEAAYIAHWAWMAGDLDLARYVLSGWQRAQPDNVQAKLQRAIVDYHAKAYGPALQGATDVLAQPREAIRASPGIWSVDVAVKEASNIQKLAAARLREEVKKLPSSEPPSAPPKSSPPKP